MKTNVNNSLGGDGIPISCISSTSTNEDSLTINNGQFNNNGHHTNIITRAFRNIFPKKFANGASNNPYENSYGDNIILVSPDEKGLHRNLKERHMIMIALGGTIGTGLFLASGQALASAGPGGSLVSYGIISIMVYFVMTSLVGLLVDVGAVGKPKKKYGFENWKLDGAPFVDGVRGVITTSIISGFAFQGTEAVGIAAGESSNPKRDVPRAMNGTIWRIILFFVGAIFIMGLVIPYNDPNLAKIGGVENVAVSPFTLVFARSGIPGAEHIMNAVILTTILSAGNSGLYLCTRIFWTLAMEGKAPRVFRHLTKGGIPIWCLVITTVLASSLFGLSFVGNKVIYIWLVNMTSVMGFIAWFGIAVAHYRFRRAYILQVINGYVKYSDNRSGNMDIDEYYNPYSV
ncbi:unnamed protein product [Rotaria sordida]|uniref:Amino acid permease/ SLC12A domain-containing protein n=1 Tax=Rotaria sordida TaxID=392033 RepID=A0A818JGD3_9BILA|nr:unnamed protein product [Rotaria sordida]CAF0917853.1 unnamed protein product [Rotaria sordida]CAF3542303.1 unnamed protein product [Rotaria sordida]CAF3559087.1 unnamed protein product [Rotaria sordida]